MKADKDNKKNSGITPNEKSIQELKTSTLNKLNNKLSQLFENKNPDLLMKLMGDIEKFNIIMDILEIKEMGCITIIKNEHNNISLKFSIIAEQLPKEKIIHLINQTKKNVFELEAPGYINKTISELPDELHKRNLSN
jgi:hypothetical protein